MTEIITDTIPISEGVATGVVATNQTCPPDSNMGKLSIIIPIRCIDSRKYIIQRLKYLSQYLRRENIEVIIVDSGSEKKYAIKIKKICAENNLIYYFLDTGNQVFSPGEARNYGAAVANGQFIIFQDIDLLPPTDFYERLLSECTIRKMTSVVNDFFVVPCIYLTQNGTDYFLQQDNKARFDTVFHKYLFGDNDVVQFMAPFSSCIVVRKDHFLSIGGHDPAFSGHGYEDFDVAYRLSLHCKRFRPPIERHLDTGRYDLTQYRGLRAMLAVHGTPLLAKGIFVAHLWHPRPDTQGFERQRVSNRARLNQNMKKFDNQSDFLPPLIDQTVEARILVLAEEGHWTLNPVRLALPLMGKLVYRRAEDFENEAQFSEYLTTAKIDGVFSNNPYGNSQRLRLYKYCRRAGIPYLTFDRGGLPDSWFFDWNGFNADSSSYQPSGWDHPLTAIEERRVRRFIKDTMLNDKTLEKNGPRTSGRALRLRYRIGDKRILFVPFQRPTDTATVYFAGAIGGTEQFVQLLDDVASKLPAKDWIVLAKTHPLEKTPPNAKNVTFVEPDTHIHDLLEAADAVLTMNSGVGLLAAIHDTMCIYCSEAYYGHEGIAWPASDSRAILQLLSDLRKPDKKRLHRFVHFLRYKFYSFGEADTEMREQPNGQHKTITKRIRFYELRGINGAEYKYRWNTQTTARSAPILMSFSHWQAVRQVSAGQPVEGGASVRDLSPRTAVQPNARFVRKIRKLFRSPRKFLRDSKIWQRIKKSNPQSRGNHHA